MPWPWVKASTRDPLAPPHASAPLPDAGAAVGAAGDDQVVEVDYATGVQFRVPSWAKHERIDTHSISITANNATIVVAVSTKKQRAAPVDGIVSLAKDEKMSITSITTDGDRTFGRMNGPQKVAAIEIVVAKTYRVVVYMRADGPQDFDPLVDDFVHGSRLLLP
jgi:hypothetical protein